MHDVDCCRLTDGSLSVRHDGHEVHILPNRLLCSPEDLERAFVALLIHCDEGSLNDAVDDACKDAADAITREMSRW